MKWIPFDEWYDRNKETLSACSPFECLRRAWAEGFTQGELMKAPVHFENDIKQQVWIAQRQEASV